MPAPLKIVNISIHHSGGLGQDAYASTAHQTVFDIDSAHKDRWHFPSDFMKKPNGAPYFFGYNVIYDPKDRKFTQGRAIGEETAAQIGFNFNTFSLCIIGNFMKLPQTWPFQPVDPLTDEIERDVTIFLNDLINGNRQKLFIVPGTIVDFSVGRLRAHRFYGQTDCYGTFITDTHFGDLISRYRPVLTTDEKDPAKEVVILQERAKILQAIYQIWASILRTTNQFNIKPASLGGVDRGCDGFIR